MAVLQIVGNQSGAGKTSLAAALLVAANAAGKKAAYYKAFSDPPGLDADAAFIGLLLQSHGGPSVPDPGKPIDAHDLANTQAAIASLQSEVDLVIVEGSDAATPLDIGGKVVLVHRYSQ